MPLKPVFEKAPLLPLQQVRLSYGQVRCDNREVRELYDLCSRYFDVPAVFEGAFGLACLLTDNAYNEKITSVILESVHGIIHGETNMNYRDQIAVARAAMAVYEYSVRKEILADIMVWCSVLETEWEDLAADRDVRQHPADLMELLLRLYRITGKRVLLRMCTRLRSSGMDWSGILNTFNQPRPLKRSMTLAEIKDSMASEEYSEDKYYTRKYLSNDAVSLSDGMRFSICCALYSGSGQQTAAAEKGWQSISKQHGTVCGGTTADRLLEGNATHRGISAAAAGSWCEALCCAMLTEKRPWASDEVMKLALNAMPAAVRTGSVIPYQRVNDLRETPDDAGCFDPGQCDEHMIQCIARLSRGYAVLYHSAVSATRGGLNINLPLDGKYAVSFDEQLCVLTIKKNIITLHSERNAQGQIGVTVSMNSDTDIHVNDETHYHAPRGNRIAIDREWNNGDTITIDMPLQLQAVETHHQGIAVYDGLRLLAYPAGVNDYAYAICGDPVRDNGKVCIPVRRVIGWNVNGNILPDVQVAPKTDGEIKNIVLVPYSETDQRISVFPKG